MGTEWNWTKRRGGVKRSDEETERTEPHHKSLVTSLHLFSYHISLFVSSSPSRVHSLPPSPHSFLPRLVRSGVECDETVRGTVREVGHETRLDR